MPVLNYHPRRPREEPKAPVARGLALPVGMIVAGFALFSGGLISDLGVKQAGQVMGVVTILLGVQTLLGVLAAFVTAKITGTTFGLFWQAVVRLAGIIVFCSAVSHVVPYGWLVIVVLYLFLLMWVLEIDLLDALVFAIVLSMMRLVVTLLFLDELLSLLGLK